MFSLGTRIRPVFLLRQSVRFYTSKPSNSQNLYLLDALKSSTKTAQRNKLNTNPLDILSSKPKSSSQASSTKEEFKSFLSANELKAKPKDVANQLRITGPRAGKIVRVMRGDINQAFGALNGIVRSNSVRQDKQGQVFYMKPGKRRELKSIKKRKREFLKGFQRLMSVVRDASRKGY